MTPILFSQAQTGQSLANSAANAAVNSAVNSAAPAASLSAPATGPAAGAGAAMEPAAQMGAQAAPAHVPNASGESLIALADRLGLDNVAEAMRAATTSEALSPLAMFMAADWVVKAVMLGLVAASVLAWAIWLGKVLQVAGQRRGLRRDYRALRSVARLGANVSPKGVVGTMQALARVEMQVSAGLPDEGVKERVALELVRVEAAAVRRAQAGMTVIGSVGSVAPFIGLFGTVWGIMNAFVGIAQSGSSNLAVVAPGIAEALMATAIGLVAAIPAVILYNHLTRVLGALRADLGDAASLVERTLSRDLDRARHMPEPGPETAQGEGANVTALEQAKAAKTRKTANGGAVAEAPQSASESALELAAE